MKPIGIMGAMLEEIAHLKEAMSISQIHVKGGREYICGKLFGRDVVLVFSRWGKVASALTATTLISTFNVDQIIFTGVAGGAAFHLNIGDVVIGKELYQHDMDASPLFEKFEIPFLSLKTFKADPDLLQHAEKGVLSFFTNQLPSSHLKEF
ncbi:MAG: 5'-methylthioadenosine/S-adenosylhomocysteine nucleosidase, partial [Chlamydiae bacterium]|nr:5'-methylthioadenosine/S-adenosylhomocysteine nucleosidase [Chlamydiota bacterium]